MYTNQVVGALRRQKALLQQVVTLAEYQLELIRSGRLNDFERLISLRAKPMSEMAEVEGCISAHAPKILSGHFLSTPELDEVRHLNLEIIRLTNRIVDIDEQTNQFTDIEDVYLSIDSFFSSEFNETSGRHDPTRNLAN